jgi:A/G-specific adenine glycosylase
VRGNESRAALAASLSAPLLAWFDANRRDLPWRRTRDPYRIWVSEVMLQQTQVATVVPYYRRFLQAFPTVRALAEAPLDEVLRLWAGLGYYSRARNLHRAAQRILDEHAGRLPASFAELGRLPGLGAYTAGAVASIAFGERVPCIDGNVIRVLARAIGLTGDVRAGRGRQRLQRLAQAAVPADRPGDHNQALMELGALICRPRDPLCEACCLSELCEARRLGRQARIPAPRRRPRTQVVRMAAALVERRGRVLIARRPPEGVWGGLWEFPNVQVTTAERPEAALSGYLADAFGLAVEVGESVMSVTHCIMHRRIELTAYRCRVLAGRTQASRHTATRWLPPPELAAYALPAPHRSLAGCGDLAESRR